YKVLSYMRIGFKICKFDLHQKSPIDDSYNINIKEYRYIGDSYVLFFNPAYVCVSGADNGVFYRLCLFDGGTARLCGASA
ncbi:hypothetical protein GWH50_001790, partial [Neisseria gonorrhoeae]